jgi:hypothetical protein
MEPKLEERKVRNHNRLVGTLGLFVVGGILLAACSGVGKQPAAQVTAQPQGLPTTPPSPMGGEQEASANEGARRAQETLSALLNVDISAVSIITVEAVQWPNTCLGVEIPGQMCAMHVVDGYRVILEVNDQRYEYHANGDGSSLQPALALTWHREGGIAGFCDDLIVNVVGEAAAGSCRGAPPTEKGFTLLKAEQRAEMGKWLSTLRAFSAEHKDPAVADAMTIRIVFDGWGTTEATDAKKHAVEEFAAELYADMTAPPTPAPVLQEPDNVLAIREVQVDASRIGVSGKSALPDGTCIQTELRANGQAQDW